MAFRRLRLGPLGLALAVALGAAPASGTGGATAPATSALACDPGADAWRDPGRWARLRRGMTRFDVFCLLGEPGKVSAYDGFERWEYPAALGARVHFDDRGRTVGWRASGRGVEPAATP